MDLKLPSVISSRADLLKLYRELEALERWMQGEHPEASLPKVSKHLEVIARENALDLHHQKNRQDLYEFIGRLKSEAPVVHMSFAGNPSAAVVTKLVGWFRANAHQHTLMQIGVQPNIAGGCTLRTTSKYFDFSLRRHFKDKEGELAAVLRSDMSNEKAGVSA